MLRLNFPSVLLVPSHFHSGNFIFPSGRSITFRKLHGFNHQSPLECVRPEVTDEEALRTHFWPSQELQALPARKLCSSYLELCDVEEKIRGWNLEDLD